MNISWVESNGTFSAYEDDLFVGMVSRNPCGTLDAGKWSATVHTIDGGLIVLGPYNFLEIAKTRLEEARAKKQSYEQWRAEREGGT